MDLTVQIICIDEELRCVEVEEMIDLYVYMYVCMYVCMYVRCSLRKRNKSNILKTCVCGCACACAVGFAL